MPAFNLGYLLRGAGNALTGYRQGTREREARERQEEIEEAGRLFSEWSQKRTHDRADEQLKETREANRLSREERANERALQEANRRRDDRARAAESRRKALEGNEWTEAPDLVASREAEDAGLPVPTFGSTAQEKPSVPKPAAPYRGRIGKSEYNAPVRGGGIQHQIIDGSVLRRDPQAVANEEMEGEQREQQNKLDLQREIAPPRQRTQAILNNKTNQYEVIDMDKLGPTGIEGRPPTDKDGGSVRVLAGDTRELMALRNMAYAADVAAKSTKDVDNFVGPINRGWHKLRTAFQNSDPRVAEAQRAWAALASPLINKTFGAALSEREDARIQPWLPGLQSSDEATVRNSIAQIQKSMRDLYNDRLDVMEAMGKDVTKLRALGLENKSDGDGGVKPNPGAPVGPQRNPYRN